MKICFKCGITKDRSEFYRHPKMADGLCGKCKDCTRRDNTLNRRAKLDYYQAYDRERGNLSHRAKSRKEYATTENGRKALRRAAASWAVRNPRKRAAQVLFRNWMRFHPEAWSPCVICGSDKSQGHHENYDKPLEVVWLCAAHHAERHKEMRREGIIP